jgi:hypothetical protein
MAQANLGHIGECFVRAFDRLFGQDIAHADPQVLRVLKVVQDRDRIGSAAA